MTHLLMFLAALFFVPLAILIVLAIIDQRALAIIDQRRVARRQAIKPAQDERHQEAA
jgi:hypothetical protein